jgi:adenine-specific DNA-methyltransferase
MNTDFLVMQSPDRVNENVEKLAALFPNCLTETTEGRLIDFDLLKQELNHAVVEGNKERYRLEWPGKREAIVTANLPTTQTLRPIREDSVDFDTTENLYIEGDNLKVLKLLQESYLGKIKMIYIDPPYNTGHDFVYKDNFTADKETELLASGQIDEYKQRLIANPETAGRYHSDWLTMMYPRLKLARNLLADDGVIFISIDDNEVHNLRKICDEIFGEGNFVGQIAIINNLKGRNDRKNIATCHEHLLIFCKIGFEANGLPLTEEQKAAFNQTDENGNSYQLRDLRKRGRPDRREDRPNMYFPIYYNQETKNCSLEYHEDWMEIFPLRGDGSDGRWRWGRDRVLQNLTILEPKYSQIAGRWGVEHRVYLNPALAIGESGNDDEDEERSSKSKSFWMGGELSTDVARRQFRELMDNTAFDYPKSMALLEKIIYMGANDNSIILDFFSGSATTADAVMQLNTKYGNNRKFIMVQLPEATDEKSEAYKAGYKNICEIGKERIRRAGKKIVAEKAKSDGIFAESEKKLDVGFRVYRLDSSNMQDVYYKPQNYQQTNLDLFADNVKPDRTADDLLAQVMLDWGLPLSLKIERMMVSGKEVFKVAENSLYACFDADIDEAFAKEIAKDTPLRIVFRDSGFKDDTAKSNVKQLLKQLSPETEMKVI